MLLIVLYDYIVNNLTSNVFHQALFHFFVTILKRIEELTKSNHLIQPLTVLRFATVYKA